jgi:hypothetical protein
MPGDKNCLSPLAVGKNISDELVMNWNWVDAGRCCQDAVKIQGTCGFS